MFAGHIGAALAIGRSERRINAGYFVLAALLADILLWVFVLLGWESITIPADFGTSHQAEFGFPYSHGLAASGLWSAAAGCLAWACGARLGAARLRVAALLAAAVLTHWLLDALVHRPELPLAGASSAAVGLALWRHMPLALAVEALVLFAGLWLFLSGAALPLARKAWLAALCLLLLAFTVAGMTVAPAPPSASAMAVSSLLTDGIVCGLIGWLARVPPR